MSYPWNTSRKRDSVKNHFLEETLVLSVLVGIFLLFDTTGPRCSTGTTLSPICTRGVRGLAPADFEEALVALLLARLTELFGVFAFVSSGASFGLKSGSFGLSLGSKSARTSWLSGSNLRVGLGVIFGPGFGFLMFVFFNGVLRFWACSLLCSSMSVVWIKMSDLG